MKESMGGRGKILEGLEKKVSGQFCGKENDMGSMCAEYNHVWYRGMGNESE